MSVVLLVWRMDNALIFFSLSTRFQLHKHSSHMFGGSFGGVFAKVKEIREALGPEKHIWEGEKKKEKNKR